MQTECRSSFAVLSDVQHAAISFTCDEASQTVHPRTAN